MVISFLLCLFLSGCRGERPLAVLSTPDGPKRFSLELAVTEEERRRGLMFRTDLSDDEGMLFIFEKDAPHAFWMKNTYMSLDVILLSRDGTVVDLLEGLPPCAADPCPAYRPRFPGRYALEIKAGGIARHGLQRGQGIRLEGLPEEP